MLSERQIKLLQAIINDYISTAEPVGSVEVVKKYGFGCSPATMRNEMAKLVSLGFLEMLHTSSGRVPTKIAYRYYLDELMEEEEMPVLQEVAIKQRLWPFRHSFHKMLKEATLGLSETVKQMAIATMDDGFVINSGAVNILDSKEFWDIDTAKTALTVADSYPLLSEIFRKFSFGDGVSFAIEDELGIENLENSTLAFASYKAGEKNGHICVFGPSRMDYGSIIPAIKYTKKVLEELGSSW